MKFTTGIVSLFIFMVFLCAPQGALSAEKMTAPGVRPDVQVKPMQPKTPDLKKDTRQKRPVRKQPQINKHGLKLRKAARITNLEIGTRSDGKWYWRASVKNIGAEKYNSGELILQGHQVHFAPIKNPFKAGSGKRIMQPIMPGSTVQVQSNWNRCCETLKLRVELSKVGSSTPMDSEEISGLIHYHGYYVRVFDTKVKAINWDSSDNSWQAELVNNTPYFLEMLVQGYLIKDGQSPVPAGGQRIIMPPNSTKTSMKLHPPNPQNGDQVKVVFYYRSDEGYCGESLRDCGGTTGNIITIPNSRTF